MSNRIYSLVNPKTWEVEYELNSIELAAKLGVTTKDLSHTLAYNPTYNGLFIAEK